MLALDHVAGGYGDHAWRCAYRLARLVITGRPWFGDPVDPSVAWFREAAGRLSPADLQATEEESWELSEEELGAQLGPARPATGLFLGYYSRTGLERALEHYGLFARVRRKGFRDLRIELDLGDRARQAIRVFGIPEGSGDEHLLIEVHAGLRELPGDDGAPLRLLSIEWLSLANPSAQFAAGRTRLPLQKHPGLGIAREVMHVLRIAAERLQLDGIVQSAAHFHGAVLLGTWGALFFDPVREGRFRTLRRTLAELRLADATSLVERGRVVEIGGAEVRPGAQPPDERPFRWEGADQMLPLSRRTLARFTGAAWLAAVEEAERGASYRLADPAATPPLVGASGGG